MNLSCEAQPVAAAVTTVVAIARSFLLRCATSYDNFAFATAFSKRGRIDCKRCFAFNLRAVLYVDLSCRDGAATIKEDDHGEDNAVHFKLSFNWRVGEIVIVLVSQSWS